MHRIKTNVRAPLGLLAAIAGLVAIIGLMPMFGSTAYAAGLNLNNVVNVSRFDIPNGPITFVAAPVWLGGVVQPGTGDPAELIIADSVQPLFPASGEIVLGLTINNKAGTELMRYDQGATGCIRTIASSTNAAPISITTQAAHGLVTGTSVTIAGHLVNTNANGTRLVTVTSATTFTLNGSTGNGVGVKTGTLAVDNSFCIVERAKAGEKKTWAAGTMIQLGTQLTAPLTGTPGQALLKSSVAEAATVPITIAVDDDTSFSATGFLTISHQDTDAGGQSSEYFSYTGGGNNDNAGAGGTDQLVLTARGQSPNNNISEHKATGYTAAGGTPGVSKVNEHSQIQVKSNVGFFPTGNLLIYNVDGGNNVINEELVGRNQAIAPKIVPSPALGTTRFYVTERGGAPTTFDKTAVVPHATDSIVVSASSHLICRARNTQPIPGEPGAQNPAGSSAGTLSVCYTSLQPAPGPKKDGTLDQPLIGSTLITLNALNQPFLSTGGFGHLLYGQVPHVDTNGTTNGDLDLTSPCIIEFTPGSNLQVTVTDIDVSDKSYANDDDGFIRVVTDTIHGLPNSANPVTDPNQADNCDDPAGTGPITLHTYIYPGDADLTDDDTDGDGCADDRELRSQLAQGGQRDPWNVYDWYDTPLLQIGNKDKAINISDVSRVVARFGSKDFNGADPSVPDKSPNRNDNILTTALNAPPNYHPALDRNITYGPKPHNLSKGEGVINISDVSRVVAQFGGLCFDP